MKGLSVLVAAPWERERYAARVARVVRRYEAALALGAEGAAKPRARLRVELVVGHPGGLTEAEAIPPEILARRLTEARVEQSSLRQGAPLPAPPESTGRVRTLALADLTWLVREARLLRRLRRGLPSANGLAAAYAGLAREDPLPADDPAVLNAAASIPGAEVRRRLVALLAVRHGRADLASLLDLGGPAGRAGRVRVGAAGEIPEGGAKRVEAYGRVVAVFRHRGRLFALDDACPHRGGPLGKGEIDASGAVLCPLHAWPFDLETGCFREDPKLCVRTYRVQTEDGAVFLAGPIEP